MSVSKRLDKLYRECIRHALPKDAKILFLADLHLCDAGPTDDFRGKEGILAGVLREKLKEGYWLVILGDYLDLWEVSDREKIITTYPEVIGLIGIFQQEGRCVIIRGNHDRELLGHPEAVILEVGDLKIFCVHGHQGDWANDQAWWWGKYFVRYVWVPLQWIGLHDPTKSKAKKHAIQRQRLLEWAKGLPLNERLNHGHDHMPLYNAWVIDPGSWVGEKGQGIEFKDGQFEMNTWG